MPALVLFFTIACSNKNSADDSGPGVVDDSSADDSDTLPCTEIIFYADSDTDGYGDAATTKSACEQPSGFTTSSDDCDDSKAAVHPGAEEVCDGLDNDCDTTTDIGATDEGTWYADADEDGYGGTTTTTSCTMPKGYTAANDDCDDSSAAVNPTATEVCNEIDDDCDLLVDTDDIVTGAATWYDDADLDSYGDPTTGVVACEQPAGTVTNDDDCDDSEIYVNPAVEEWCDGFDNDCNTLVDDDDSPVFGTTTFYADTDADLYGDASASIDACLMPTGYVTDATDCDDDDVAKGPPIIWYKDADRDAYGNDTTATTPLCDAPTGSGPYADVGGDCEANDAAINPGASETCDEGDENCDGLEDEVDPTLIWDIWYVDTDGDGFGSAIGSVESCNSLIGYRPLAGDCDDTSIFVYPSAPELCDAIDNDCDGSTDEDGTSITVPWYADTDGDGYGDATVSVSECSQPSGYVINDDDCDDGASSTNPGAPDICANAIDDDCDGYPDNCIFDIDDAGAVIQGYDLGQGIGLTLAVADFDADGTDDILLGSEWAEQDDGRAYIVNGPVSGTYDVSGAVAFEPSVAHNYFGAVIEAGDANGDDAGDAIISPTLGAKVFLFLGPTTANRSDLDADAVIDVAAPLDMEFLPDVDGDGSPDVGLTADQAYVLPGDLTGTIDVKLDSTYAYTGGTVGGIPIILQEVASMGDANGDGIGEIAFGATNATDGLIYIVEGGDAPGVYDASAVALADLKSQGEFAYTMTTTDYDGDGYGDIIANAPEVKEVTHDHYGSVYAFLGPLAGSLDELDADTTWMSMGGAGKSLATADFDADGAIDIAMGNPYGEYDQGFVFIQFGTVTGTVDDVGLFSIPGKTHEWFATSLHAVDDWTGDGGAELVIGASALGATGLWGAGGNGGAYVVFSEEFIP